MPPNACSSSRPSSTALLPRTPVRRSTASSSASLSACGALGQQPLARPLGQRPVRNRHVRGLSLRIALPLNGARLDPMTLTGKRILLGITGGIAAYKAAELTRLLVKAGADVRVAMTEAATRFVGTATMQALSGQPVWTDLWDARVNDAMGHIELSRDRDLILVAPASADFMAKLAHGLRRRPAVDAVRGAALPADGGAGDERGDVAERGDRAQRRDAARRRRADRRAGVGRPGVRRDGHGAHDRAGATSSPTCSFFFSRKPRAVACRAGACWSRPGPTEEPVDPVRVLTNTSSGKMGYAVARAAREAGAEVTLISGPVSLPTPAGVARVDVRTAQEMFDAVKKDAKSADVFISVAAVADYRVKNPAAQKIKKANGQPVARAGGEPGHPRLGRGAAQAAVLRRLRRGEREPGAEREGEAGEEEAAADRRQPGAGGDRPRRQRDHALRRERRAPARPRPEARAGAQAGRARRRQAAAAQMRKLEVKILDERIRSMLPHYATPAPRDSICAPASMPPLMLQPGRQPAGAFRHRHPRRRSRLCRGHPAALGARREERHRARQPGRA